MSNQFSVDYDEKVTPVANDKVLLADSADSDIIKYGKYTNFIGQPGIVRRGVYNALTAYVATDVVSYNNSAYYCILASTGNLPTNTTYWTPFAVGAGIGGPVTSVDGEPVLFDGTDGQNIKGGSGVTGFVTTSSGAGDENKVPVLNASGQLATGFVNLADTTFQYGNGSDGDVTITTTVTLTSDMQYNNLAITGSGILKPAGYKIYVAGTLSGDGKIQSNGGNGGNASGVTVGTAGATPGAGSLNANIAGATGGAAYSGNAVGAASNPSYSNILAVAGGKGGWGQGVGVGTDGGVGTAGLTTRGVLYNLIINNLTEFFNVMTFNPASGLGQRGTQYKVIAQSGGGGGGGGSLGNFAGGAGGGSGANGGLIRLSVNILNWTGTFEAIGGNGGNGGNGTSNGSNGGGGGGGGGGGNGGILYLIYKTLTAIGTKTFTGGTKGTHGNAGGGVAPGTNGEDGTDGNAGTSIEIDI